MKKALKITVNVLAWILLIFALLITLTVFSSSRNNGIANLFGFMPMSVESDSMSPTFKKGDMIVCKEVDDINTLKQDDVITFWTLIDGKRVKNTHRIVSVEQEGGSYTFITRGDNNPINDELPVHSSDLIGKWTGMRIPFMGKAMDFLRTKTGFFICIIIPMVLFFLFELYKFIATLIEAKRPAVAEIDEEEIKRRAIEEYLASQKAAADAKPEEPKPEEPKAEEPKTEEPKAEELKSEEPQPEATETPAEAQPETSADAEQEQPAEK